jgi:hypothetical protein
LPRGAQIGRWWTIVQELRASRLGLPAETLAQRHGWNPRTVDHMAAGGRRGEIP